MRLLIIPMMFLGTLAYSQTIVVQKCASSALEETTFVTVKLDSSQHVNPMMNSTLQVVTDMPVPTEEETADIPVQVSKAKKDD
jgi:hypothetical protein